MRVFLVAALSCALIGCAGRSPQMIPVVQATDQHMSCEMIMAEVKINNDKISELSGEEGKKVAQNVAAGVVGLVVWPMWFAMDFQDAAGKEGKALMQRNEYLATLANQRCAAPPQTTSSIAKKR